MTEIKITKCVDNINYTIPVVWCNNLVSLNRDNNKFTITLLKENLESFIEMGLLYTTLTNAGATVKLNVSKDILTKHKDTYIPKHDFLYSEIFFIYEKGSWYKGNTCIAKDNIKFSDFIYKLIDNSINLANKNISKKY